MISLGFEAADLFQIRPSINLGNESGYRGHNAITNF